MTRCLLLLLLLAAPAGTIRGEAAPERVELQLRAARFDPLREAPPEVLGAFEAAPLLRVGLEDRYRLVQFDRKINPALREHLERSGIEVLHYVPSHAFIVRLPVGEGDAALVRIGGVRWVGAVMPGYKIDPELAQALRDGGLLERVALDVGLFAGEDPGALAEALEANFRTVRIEHIKTRPPPRIAFDVAPAEAREATHALARDPAVSFVARRSELVPHNDQSVWIGQAFDTVNGPAEAAEPDPKSYASSATIWNRGLRGEGQVLAVADTGLEHELCYFADPENPVTVQNVAAPNPIALDPAHRKILAVNASAALGLLYDDWFRHGTHTSATAVADDLANLAGVGTAGHDHGDGVAPAAKLVFEDISGPQSSSCSTSMSVASLQDLLVQEHLAGARVSSNSWGSSMGGFEFQSLETDAGVFALEDLLVVVSAGNNGTEGAMSLIGLATCKNCLSVGATETWDPTWPEAVPPLHPENMGSFSSRGPTADGRTKPDIAAPGYRVDSVRFPVTYHDDETAPPCDSGDPDICLPSFGGCYEVDTSATCTTQLLSGTSQATPAVAGLALLARQYFTEGFHPTGTPAPADALAPTAALLKAVLINGARNMTGHLYTRHVVGPDTDLGLLADAPSNVQGWGRAMLEDVLYFPGDARRVRLFDLPHASGIATGASVTQSFAVTASTEPLKLTLAWSDTPGTPIAFASLVNDLDLKLTAPDGKYYRGNRWNPDNPGVAGDMQSRTNASTPDAVNNVEGILLHTPVPGLYTVEVYGHEVPGGGGLVTQGAALVVTGAVDGCTSAVPPAGMASVAVANGQAVLAWDPVPGAVGYQVLRNETGCGNPMPADVVVALPAATTSFSDATVAAATSYHYTVRARMSAQGCFTEDSACASVTTPVAAGPPPVPDGTFGSPMRADRANLAGTELDLMWDVLSCPATDYHVLYGPLDAVAALEPAGAVCDLGNSGIATWSGVPPVDLWFLVVPDDGAVTEGSWGTDSTGLPRRPGVASGQCALVVRNDFGVCD